MCKMMNGLEVKEKIKIVIERGISSKTGEMIHCVRISDFKKCKTYVKEFKNLDKTILGSRETVVREINAMFDELEKSE